jgi:uncharacterized membrane protein YgcG
VATVQLLRHKFKDDKAKAVWKTEMIIVVRALERVSEQNIKQGSEILGISGLRNVEVVYGGYTFELARELGTVQGCKQCMFLNKPTLHITLVGVLKQAQNGSVADHLVRLFGLERIKYWVVRPVFRNNYRTIIVGLEGAEEPVLDRRLAASLVDTSKHWARSRISIPCKEFIGYEQDVMEIHTPVGLSSLGDLSDGKRSRERGEGGRGGRGGVRSYSDVMRSPGGESTTGSGSAASWTSVPLRQTNSYESSDSSQEQMVAGFQRQLVAFTNKMEAIEERNVMRDRKQQEEVSLLRAMVQQNDKDVRGSMHDMNNRLENNIQDMKQSLDTAVALILASARSSSSMVVDDVIQAAHGRNPNV